MYTIFIIANSSEALSRCSAIQIKHANFACIYHKAFSFQFGACRRRKVVFTKKKTSLETFDKYHYGANSSEARPETVY